jgi:hypothetical protein
LEKEGVEVVKGKIAKKYFYDFSTRKWTEDFVQKKLFWKKEKYLN